MAESTFDSWAIVEIMGHQRYAGRVTEETIGGCSFVRVDVPEVDGRPAFSKLFGQASIFCITPVAEEVARKSAGAFKTSPVVVYGALPAPRDIDDDFEKDDDWDDDDDCEPDGPLEYLERTRAEIETKVQ
jgi:hypothetical protein